MQTIDPVTYHHPPGESRERILEIKALRDANFGKVIPDCYAPGEKQRRYYRSGMVPPRIPGTNRSPAFDPKRLLDFVTTIEEDGTDLKRVEYPPGTLLALGVPRPWYHLGTRLRRWWTRRCIAWRISRLRRLKKPTLDEQCELDDLLGMQVIYG